MNQVIIDVELRTIDKIDMLCFKFDVELNVNLNSESGQQDLKKVFSVLLEKSIEADIELKLTQEADYSKSLYIEVCQEYIKALNIEIKRAIADIRKLLVSTK